MSALQAEQKSLEDAIHHFQTQAEPSQVSQSLQELLQCSKRGGKIFVIGVGKSGKIGSKIAATLSSTGTPAIFVHPTEALHGDLGVVTPQDCILAISQGGNTEEILRLIPFFKRKGVPLISICGNANSKLVENSKAFFSSAVAEEACPYNLAPTSSTTLALAIGDAIAIALMKEKGFTAEDFAKNHPAGSLGRRLQISVADLMHSLETCAIVSPHALMDEVLEVSTRKKLGAVLVLQNQQLIGVITDGDIRRSLKQRESFFTLTAAEAMTHNPICVTSDTLAYDALRLMEERQSQISVLPVVDSQKNILGLIRIHDLVQTL